MRCKHSLLFIVPLIAACSSAARTPQTDAEFRLEVPKAVHTALLSDVDALATAAAELRDAAPVTPGRGWDRTADARAIEAMRAAWVKARSAYERIEGAVAPIFPDIDTRIDARYDDFLSEMSGRGDDDLFDDRGVTGMHAVERILYVDTTPASVVDLERSLPGYKAAALPATEAEARAFKEKLCAKLVADVEDLRSQWKPAELDLAAAFQGLNALVLEQREKVNKAASQEEESRYAQRTLADLRANLEGVEKAYAAFKPWAQAKKGTGAPGTDGTALSSELEAGFGRLRTLYASYEGDALPAPPATWTKTPSEADLATPFGRLWAGVGREVDPNVESSIADNMNHVAELLGFPELKVEP